MAATQTPPAARATVRYLHVSPSKVRQVLALIRGLPVEDAERVLQLCEKDAADDVLKLLNSAIANAEHGNELEAEELFIARAWADEGPTRKWGQPRARGRYFRIRKRTSHVTIYLDRFAVDELEDRRRRDEAAGRGSAAAQRSRAERVRRSRQTEEAEATTEAPEEEVEEVEAPEAEATEAPEATAPVAGDEAEDEAEPEAEEEPEGEKE
jgi:large subunit ribosomal protein L22